MPSCALGLDWIRLGADRQGYVWRGGADPLVQEMWFFTQAAFVTFGGAYAVLSFMVTEYVGSGAACSDSTEDIACSASSKFC